jgi:outer membrane lipoprotein-sorting protein
MKKLTTILIMIFISAFVFGQRDGRPRRLLDDVSKKINSYENVYIEFNYKLQNKEENVSQETHGDVTMKGDLYNVNFLGVNQFYDGKKVYTVNAEDEEVNISEGDPEDEDLVTPSKFFSFYKNGFTYSWDEKKILKNKKIQYVKLVPIDSNSEIKKILLGVDNKSKHIYKIIETGNNGTVTTLLISTFKTNQLISSKLFTFDEAKYKKEGYIINNLE